MQKNSTDQIAKQAWEATKLHWKAFILPLFAPAVLLLALKGIIISFNLEDSKIFALEQLFLWSSILFYLTHFTATAKWCEEIYSGGKDLNLKAGLLYGFSKIGGILGTSFVTTFKVCLWTMLLVIPGIHKTLTYSQSIHITQLEKISGGKANRLSEILVGEAGTLRTLGNYLSIFTMTGTTFLGFCAIIFFSFSTTIFRTDPISIQMPHIELSTGIVLVGCILGQLIVFAFMNCFTNFQYLTFREENKAVFEKAIKELQKE